MDGFPYIEHCNVEPGHKAVQSAYELVGVDSVIELEPKQALQALSFELSDSPMIRYIIQIIRGCVGFSDD